MFGTSAEPTMYRWYTVGFTVMYLNEICSEINMFSYKMDLGLVGERAFRLFKIAWILSLVNR